MCTTKNFIHLCIVCFLVCVHHSHQAENLPQDVAKDQDRSQPLASKVLDHHDHDDEPLPALRSADQGGGNKDKEEEHHDHQETTDLSSAPMWLAGSLAILLISLCGVFGVLVIPIMQKVFYQHLIQFLVALAVGTLAGDALLHLFPHALMAGLAADHEHEHSELHEAFHQNSVWKGFVALVALLLFFLSEKMINIFGEWRETQRMKQREKKVRIVREGHKASDRAVGEKLCKHKYSSYCVTDIDLDSLRRLNENNTEDGVATVENEVSKSGDPDLPARKKSGLLPALSDSCLNQSCSDRKWSAPLPKNDNYETVFIREHEHVHHGHSHAHSHLTSAPDSISSVAWMVIFGDGIHNLADGMAVGAAFAEGYMSGISTSIAVLCHELPHEIGDFAMLLKAGMSIKQAVFYNILSSLLSFLGMVCGILLGNIENVTPWIFVATAGIFLYVALVDMIPELNSGHSHPYSNSVQHESHVLEIVLQVLGMSVGAGIMLLIALYEHELKNAFVGYEHTGH